MTISCPFPPKKQTNKHTFYPLTAVSHLNSMRLPSLTMSLPLKVFTRGKVLKKSRTKYFQESRKKSNITEENK